MSRERYCVCGAPISKDDVDRLRAENEELTAERDCRSGDPNLCKCYEKNGFPCYRHLYESAESAEAKLKVAVESHKEIANSRFCSYEETPPGVYGVGVADGHRYCANISKEALAKIGGDDE